MFIFLNKLSNSLMISNSRESMSDSCQKMESWYIYNLPSFEFLIFQVLIKLLVSSEENVFSQISTILSSLWYVNSCIKNFDKYP